MNALLSTGGRVAVAGWRPGDFQTHGDVGESFASYVSSVYEVYRLSFGLRQELGR